MASVPSAATLAMPRIVRTDPRTPFHEPGTTLEYTVDGRYYHPMSYHESVAEAMDAFTALRPHVDRDPDHYRVLTDEPIPNAVNPLPAGFAPSYAGERGE